MTDAWQNAFGAGLNIGVDVPTTVAGNGLGNTVGGGVAAIGDQQLILLRREGNRMRRFEPGDAL